MPHVDFSTKLKALERELLALSDDDCEAAIRRVEDLAKEERSPTDRLLLGLLKGRSPWLRERVVEALHEYGREFTARKAARVGLTDRNEFVRDLSAQALGEVGLANDVTRFIAALPGEHWTVRCEIAWALGQMDTKRSIRAAIRLMNRDRYWCVRRYAALGLVASNRPGIEDAIERRLKREPDVDARVGMLCALMQRGQDRIAELVDALFDEQASPLTSFWVVETMVEWRDEGKRLPPDQVERVRYFFVANPQKPWVLEEAKSLFGDEALTFPVSPYSEPDCSGPSPESELRAALCLE